MSDQSVKLCIPPELMAIGDAAAAAVVTKDAQEPKRRCPYRPLEFKVVVELDPTEEKTKGGIILVSDKVERDKLATEEGTLVAVSPFAFSYADWPEGTEPPKEGARVMIARYAGLLREVDGKSYRIVNDKDIVAVIEGED